MTDRERELISLDMSINIKKSCCLRIGSRDDSICANISTLSGHVIPWVDELRNLGINIKRSCVFKCSLDQPKRVFYRATNGLFGKIARTASENGYVDWGSSVYGHFRNRADLTEVFKMYTGLSILKFDLFEVSNNSHTRRHSLKLAKHQCRLDLRKYFFCRKSHWQMEFSWSASCRQFKFEPFQNCSDKNKKCKDDGFLHGSFRLTPWSSVLLWRVDLYAPPT